jgi:hypothetical protein
VEEEEEEEEDENATVSLVRFLHRNKGRPGDDANVEVVCSHHGIITNQ